MSSTRILTYAATAPVVGRARPRGLDRVLMRLGSLVMRLGVAMLRWANRRAERPPGRPAVSYEDQALLMQNARARELREWGYRMSAPRFW